MESTCDHELLIVPYIIHLSRVKLAIDLRSPLINVAIKVMSVDDAKRNTRLKTEILIHRNMKHDNIIRLYEILEDSQFQYMVMEYAAGKTMLTFHFGSTCLQRAGGELFDKIRKH